MDKVYVVYGVLDRNSDGEYRVYGAFRLRIFAEEYMISLAREALDDLGVPPESRKCWYVDGKLYGILDNDDYFAELYLSEVKIED